MDPVLLSDNIIMEESHNNSQSDKCLNHQKYFRQVLAPPHMVCSPSQILMSHSGLRLMVGFCLDNKSNIPSYYSGQQPTTWRERKINKYNKLTLKEVTDHKHLPGSRAGIVGIVGSIFTKPRTKAKSRDSGEIRGRCLSLILCQVLSGGGQVSFCVWFTFQQVEIER